jgi:hypothetical protein
MGATLSLDSFVPVELIPPATSETRDLTGLRQRIAGLVRQGRRTPGIERRNASRMALPILMELNPSPRDVPQSLAIEMVVVGKDLSDGGIGFFHDRPIPYRRGLITIRHDDGPPLTLEVDISWCRFTRMGWYESGGRILAIVDADPIS